VERAPARIFLAMIAEGEDRFLGVERKIGVRDRAGGEAVFCYGNRSGEASDVQMTSPLCRRRSPTVR